MSTVNIPKEIDKTCKELIDCFESAIRYLEEIRSGDIDETGNIKWLLHDWSIKHEGYNDALQGWWNELGDFYDKKFPNDTLSQNGGFSGGL